MTDIYYSRNEAQAVIEYLSVFGLRNSEGLPKEYKVVKHYDRINESGNGRYYFTVERTDK